MASPHPAPQPTRIGKRVLGSTSTVHHTPNSSFFNARISPSASEVSLTSRSDLSRGPEGLVCPICSEEMMTLLQLNRHLDDTHAEVEPLEKDDITTWFRKRMLKAKTFQPVAVLNQKLKGLDVFESNDSSPLPVAAAPIATPATTPPVDPDFFVTRAHWQKSYGDDFCLDSLCRRPLGVVNGCVNCRRCGKLFCEEHTMYQIKLSRSAQHEPVRGYWSRVCETCYKSRQGYNDHHGVVQDHTAMFQERRRTVVERHCLEVRRAEKRLTKLTQLLTTPPSPSPPPSGGFIMLKSFLPASQRRALEQSVVTWQDDDLVQNCPYCAQTFSRFTQPKHHCRVCGKVVCGDTHTLCSRETPLDVAVPSEKPGTAGVVTLSVRLCTECITTLFAKRDFATSLGTLPPYVRAYATLVSFRAGIQEQMPRFQRMVEDPSRILEAVKMKRRVVESLAKVDAVAKEIVGGTGAEGRLRNNIALATANWGREVGVRVKTLAAILDSAVAAARPGAREEVMARLGKPLSPAPRRVVVGNEHASVQAGKAQKEEKEEEEEDTTKRNIIVVLEEQKFLLLQMLEDAKKRRRFDEVEALGSSLEEIEEEVEAMGGGVVGV